MAELGQERRAPGDPHDELRGSGRRDPAVFQDGKDARGVACAAERVAPFVTDTALLLNEAIAGGESVMFEGAQGTMLDIDHGTYPFVTSSSATSGGAVTGTGVAPNAIRSVILMGPTAS